MRLAVDGITNPALGPNLASKSGQEFLGDFIPAAVGIAFLIGLLVFLLAFFMGALKWIYSGGDKALLEDARKHVLHAVVGFLLLLSALAVVRLIEDFFGINILSIDIGSLQIK